MQQERPKARVVRTASAVSPKAPKRKLEELSEGDTLEFGATVEVKRRGLSFWPKASATTTIRPGESVEDAKARLTNVVITFIEEQTSEFLSD